MKITEKRECDYIIGKKCDTCGKEIKTNALYDMIEIDWYCPMGEGRNGSTGTMDVCSIICFLKAVKRVKDMWSKIKSIKNCDVFTETIKEIDIKQL